ncbi:aldehyde dehydrogenase family protein [Sphingomonas sp.]|uniref:aldehyde dehydrogenase family protein n=1 Tax=Sphingomonas sp. TaxID=28214 RepID=UPI003D6CACB6
MEQQRYAAVIGGRRVESGAWFDVIDPATGKAFAQAARCGAGEVDAAVAAAREASEAGWRVSEAADRATLLRALSAAILADSEPLARLESQDAGKPLAQARADVKVAARYFSFYASVVETLRGDTIPVRSGAFAYSVREPFGVTAHITPWNYPIQIASRTLAPALAAGNCCVLKPAEEAPLTAIRLAELALDAGFPAGVLNVVPGFGIEAGAALSAHPGIDHLAFTGSRPIGTLIAREAANNIVPVTLELGGKSPNIVFPDADLDAAFPAIVNAIIQNAGQTCSAGSRLLVHASLYERLIEQIGEAFEGLRLGCGLDDPAIGPLISQKQRDRVAALVDAAGREARLVTGGSDVITGDLADGFFFRPTLFADVLADATIWREEVFGPVLAAASFRDEDDAVRLANSTDYGMISAVWTQDISRAHRLIPKLRSAQVYVNSYGAGGGVELPFGGYKRSGYGREKGVEGLIEYSQLKTVLINHTTGQR